MKDDIKQTICKTQMILRNLDIVKNKSRNDLHIKQVVNRFMNLNAKRALNELNGEHSLVDMVVDDCNLPLEISDKLRFGEFIYLFMVFLSGAIKSSDYGDSEDARRSLPMNVLFSALIEAQRKETCVKEFFKLNYADFISYLSTCSELDKSLRESLEAHYDKCAKYNITIEDQLMIWRNEMRKCWRPYVFIDDYVRDIVEAAREMYLKVLCPILFATDTVSGLKKPKELALSLGIELIDEGEW